jgi:hypothetical protein
VAWVNQRHDCPFAAPKTQIKYAVTAMKLLVLNKSHYDEAEDVFRVQFQTIQQFDKQQMCLVNLNLFN